MKIECWKIHIYMKAECLQTKWDAASEKGRGKSNRGKEKALRGKEKALRAKKKRVGIKYRTCRVTFINSGPNGIKVGADNCDPIMGSLLSFYCQFFCYTNYRWHYRACGPFVTSNINNELKE